MFLAVSKTYMSKDQQTALYRWIIGGMIAMVAYFAMKIDNKVDKMYDSYIQQHHVDSKQDGRLDRLELDVKELQRVQSFIGASRSTTLVN